MNPKSHANNSKFVRFRDTLADANLTPPMMDALVRQPPLASGMVDWLRGRLDPPIAHLFVPLTVQKANILRWSNQYGWGITEADFAGISLRRSPHDGLVADILMVYFPNKGGVGGVRRSLESYWTIAARNQTRSYRQDILTDSRNLRLIREVDYRPGIRRITIDLAANWDYSNGTRPVDVHSSSSASAEVLAAAAHFPNWVRAMDGISIPYVWLPGYQITLPGGPAYGSVPYLDFYRLTGQIVLHANPETARDRSWACPVLL
jgi:hypothetical protein